MTISYLFFNVVNYSLKGIEMNKFNPEAIVCADFSVDVVLFDGDLTPEECSKVFERAVHEDYPIPMLHDIIILGTELHYDANGVDTIYVHPSEIVRALRTRASELKFLADMEPPRKDGLVLPPLGIYDDIEDIPF